jgi:hypothetical protein
VLPEHTQEGKGFVLDHCHIMQPFKKYRHQALKTPYQSLHPMPFQ